MDFLQKINVKLKMLCITCQKCETLSEKNPENLLIFIGTKKTTILTTSFHFNPQISPTV